MNDLTLIILGATGDLTRRKLIPALYRLIAREKLENFIIVGAAVDKSSPQKILNSAREWMGNVDEALVKELASRFFYETINFEEEADFKKLESRVKELEKKFRLSGNRRV